MAEHREIAKNSQSWVIYHLKNAGEVQRKHDSLVTKFQQALALSLAHFIKEEDVSSKNEETQTEASVEAVAQQPLKMKHPELNVTVSGIAPLDVLSCSSLVSIATDSDTSIVPSTPSTLTVLVCHNSFPDFVTYRTKDNHKIFGLL